MGGAADAWTLAGGTVGAAAWVVAGLMGIGLMVVAGTGEGAPDADDVGVSGLEQATTANSSASAKGRRRAERMRLSIGVTMAMAWAMWTGGVPDALLGSLGKVHAAECTFAVAFFVASVVDRSHVAVPGLFRYLLDLHWRLELRAAL